VRFKREAPLARRRMLALCGGVLALALAAGACGSSSPPSSNKTSSNSGKTSKAKAVKGGTATVAVINGSQPNWIWPFIPVANYSIYNSQEFQWMMYRPLYMFGNDGQSVKVNYPLSPAKAPVYSDGGKTVTITMKGWKWSNGETVDAADVAFWINMEKAEKANYAGYTPGTFPDNLKSYTITSPDTIVLHLSQPYATTWFTYNQLATITPMPMAWDVTKVGAKAGSGGCHTSTAGCAAVYNFLKAQTEKASSYASSPIWSVVDGPWKLTSFTTSGNDTFAPNSSYSGSPKPILSELKFVAYTDDTSQYTALKSGAVDIGFIPSADLPPKPVSAALPSTNPLGSAYTLSPAYTYGIFYAQLNWKNPTLGPVFKQLYFRQALMYVNDQIGDSKAIFRGYGYPTSGGVPTEPKNPFAPAIQYANNGQGPYPFDPSKAKSVLESHGWKMVGGVMTCETPSKCGAGVASGTKLSMTMQYSTGVAAVAQQVQVWKSDASKAGIDLKPEGQTFNTIIGEDTSKSTSWQIDDAGGWVFNGPGFLPTGEPLFLTGAPNNNGSYSNPKMDNLIHQTLTNGSLSAFHQYATYNAEQLPYIWTPNTVTIQAVKNTLHGVGFSPVDALLPEYWYFTK
jgi:peptide/nickel transport system substrate-binding protein